MDKLAYNMRAMRYVRYRIHQETFFDHLSNIQQRLSNWQETFTKTLNALRKLRKDIENNPTVLSCHTVNPEYLREQMQPDARPARGLRKSRRDRV